MNCLTMKGWRFKFIFLGITRGMMLQFLKIVGLTFPIWILYFILYIIIIPKTNILLHYFYKQLSHQLKYNRYDTVPSLSISIPIIFPFSFVLVFTLFPKEKYGDLYINYYPPYSIYYYMIIFICIISFSSSLRGRYFYFCCKSLSICSSDNHKHKPIIYIACL